MNHLFMQNMQYVMQEVETLRMPKVEQTQKALDPCRKEYLQYILKHGKASGTELRSNCTQNYALPSMALRQNVRNGTVIFTANDHHRNGLYTIAKGITPQALGLDDEA